MAKPLYKLFTEFQTTAVVPVHWRVAIICQIHKKGDRENVSSFHPVSPTSIIFKIDKGILKKVVPSFLSERRVISPHQRGDAHDE